MNRVRVWSGPTAASTVFYETGDDHAHDSANPTLLGFWIYLMSDALLFASIFATFGVLGTSYAGGPTPREIFDLNLVALNTAILLVSSITYGFSMLAMERGAVRATQAWLAVKTADKVNTTIRMTVSPWSVSVDDRTRWPVARASRVTSGDGT